MAIFGGNNVIPITKAAEFVANMQKTHLDDTDKDMYNRYIKLLIESMKMVSTDGINLNEEDFCKLMSMTVADKNAISEEQLYERMIIQQFNKVDKKREGKINLENFKALLQRSGFHFKENEFETLLKCYFKNKEEITLDDFKLFATGNCVKITQSPKKKITEEDKEEK